MQYWLLKTEPEEWSWKQQVKSGHKGIEWNGVRNFQAAKNLKSMKIGDKCFFYHTGKEKKIVGIVKVIKEHFKDRLDKTNKFVSIIVQAENKLDKPVALKEIKKNVFFNAMPLVKQSRLSVMKIDIKYWKKICKMGKMNKY
jgi:predicted RNA-binding protein with PUA-like domain